MKNKLCVLLLPLVCVHLLYTSDYLGQKPPGMIPEIFAPGLVSTTADFEFSGNFYPDGKEFYFCRRDNSSQKYSIKVMKLEPNGWTQPETTAFSGTYYDYHLCFPQDGKQLIFGSFRPLSGSGSERETPSLWIMNREGLTWREPRLLNIYVPGDYPEYPSITQEGTLYFGSGESVIFRSILKNGQYHPAERLPSPINSAYSDAHPRIAPDESYMIFDSTRPGGFGHGDLYISFRSPSGDWSEPRNLGGKINSSIWEVCAGLTPDQKYVFFHRDGDIHWVNARAAGITQAFVTGHSDYDGDGRSDIALYNPQTRRWHIKDQFNKRFGKKYSIPAPGDYNGDGKTDLAYFHPPSGAWKIRKQPKVKSFGTKGDIPIPRDYNGDNKTDVAFYRPYDSTWHFHDQDSAPDNITLIAFGETGDIPVPGDYNGDGKTDLAVFRPTTQEWLIRGMPTVKFGQATDELVPADYDGDGKTDIAVWTPKNGKWSVFKKFKRRHGKSGQIPVPGDYDGDGKIDLATYDPSTGTWNVRKLFKSVFGKENDIPLVKGR